MPKIPLIVEVSWKTTIPIKTAVNGSIAPKIEVNVGPICLIALTKAILEIAVAGKARPRIYSHTYPWVSNRMPSVRHPPIMKNNAPNPMT